MPQPLPGKTRCSTGSSANAIKIQAKYTHIHVTDGEADRSKWVLQAPATNCFKH